MEVLMWQNIIWQCHLICHVLSVNVDVSFDITKSKEKILNLLMLHFSNDYFHLDQQLLINHANKSRTNALE